MHLHIAYLECWTSHKIFRALRKKKSENDRPSHTPHPSRSFLNAHAKVTSTALTSYELLTRIVTVSDLLVCTIVYVVLYYM